MCGGREEGKGGGVEEGGGGMVYVMFHSPDVVLPESIGSTGDGTREIEASDDLPPLPVASDLLRTIVLTDFVVQMIEIQLSTAQRREPSNGRAGVCVCVCDRRTSVCVCVIDVRVCVCV